MTTANVDLWMSFGDTYQHALSIPVNTCQTFSIRPLAWLRYVGFTIYGNKGHISTSEDGPEVDYHQNPILPGTYYYVSQEPSLLDPAGMDDRTSDASTISTSRADFNNRVNARDGTCVMTGPEFAEARHIVPHAKGDQYMINFMNHRNDPLYGPLNPPLDNINDTRNGIFLNPLLHHYLGASDVAFLRTPNFAMTVNDVGLIMQPTANAVGFAVHPSVAPSRLTFQHFSNVGVVAALIAPHNSDARPSGSDEWPPLLIFDAAYGCAALKAWGMIDFVQLARERTRDIYYDIEGEGEGDGGGGGDQNGDDGGGDDEQPGPCQHKRIRDQAAKQKTRKVGRSARNTADGQAGDFADMILALWMQNAKKRPRQAHAMKVDRSREKVRTWLESNQNTA